jgi:hypothetical protein
MIGNMYMVIERQAKIEQEGFEWVVKAVTIWVGDTDFRHAYILR